VRQRVAARAPRRGCDLADEKGVVTRGVLGHEPGLDPAESSLEERRAERPVPRLDPVPERDRRHAAREVLCKAGLAGGEEYRATVMGPGVTPILFWQDHAPGAYDPDLDAIANEEQAGLFQNDKCRVK
jgi:hypothetical protein